MHEQQLGALDEDAAPDAPAGADRADGGGWCGHARDRSHGRLHDRYGLGPPDWRGQPLLSCFLTKIQAALRFTLRSSIVLSLLSVAFSSSRFCCSTEAQSLLPSIFAHAMSVP